MAVSVEALVGLAEAGDEESVADMAPVEAAGHADERADHEEDNSDEVAAGLDGMAAVQEVAARSGVVDELASSCYFAGAHIVRLASAVVLETADTLRSVGATLSVQAAAKAHRSGLA